MVGALIDAGCAEDQIKSLVMSVRNQCPVSEEIVLVGVETVHVG